MKSELTKETIEEIASEAYLYLLPQVMMEITRRLITSIPKSSRGVGGAMGTLIRKRDLNEGNSKAVARMNFDFLQVMAWVDVSKEPYVIEVPKMGDRFFTFPFYDMWTECFAAPGTRTSGTGPYTFALCNPEWQGELPKDVDRINVPTSITWGIGRILVFGEDDFAEVHEIQDQFKMTRLSTWPEYVEEEFASPGEVDKTIPPIQVLRDMSARDFFLLASDLVANNKPHTTDYGIVKRLRKIGFHIGEKFDVNAQPEEIRNACLLAPTNAMYQIHEILKMTSVELNGWTFNYNIGVWGNSYVRRAAIAIYGIAANPPEESIYPNCFVDQDGEPLYGSKNYTITFTKNNLPPVSAFWSLTAYDREGFTVPNELERYSIGSRNSLTFSSDGSLTLYIQCESPGKEHENNWLPISKEGKFNLSLRLYLPKSEALLGEWAPPQVRVVE